MVVKYPIKNLKSMRSYGAFAPQNGYGSVQYGYWEYGFYNDASGIYRVWRQNGKTYHKKIDFYEYKIVHNEAVDAIRTKFKNAVIAWHGLAPAEKSRYNKRAIGRHMTGFNLFISEYMKL